MDVRRSVKPGSWRLGLLAAITALVVTACGGAAQTSAPAAESAAPPPSEAPASAPASEAPASAGAGEPVTVGFISPTTGFVAALGTDMKRGWDLYWELNGNTAGGVAVETVYEDDAGDPDGADRPFGFGECHRRRASRGEAAAGWVRRCSGQIGQAHVIRFPPETSDSR